MIPHPLTLRALGIHKSKARKPLTRPQDLGIHKSRTPIPDDADDPNILPTEHSGEAWAKEWNKIEAEIEEAYEDTPLRRRD